MPLNSQFCFLHGTRNAKIVVGGHRLSLSEAIAIHYNSTSMFVYHRAHKGPRLEARPRLMAAFYYFKAAVSYFSESPRVVQGGPPV